MGFRLAPREVAPLPPQPVCPPFSSMRPSVVFMKMNEFAFAISTVHFRTLRKWIKAISEVQADGATENTSPKAGGTIRSKNQYCIFGQNKHPSLALTAVGFAEAFEIRHLGRTGEAWSEK